MFTESNRTQHQAPADPRAGEKSRMPLTAVCKRLSPSAWDPCECVVTDVKTTKSSPEAAQWLRRRVFCIQATVLQYGIAVQYRDVSVKVNVVLFLWIIKLQLIGCVKQQQSSHTCRSKNYFTGDDRLKPYSREKPFILLSTVGFSDDKVQEVQSFQMSCFVFFKLHFSPPELLTWGATDNMSPRYVSVFILG